MGKADGSVTVFLTLTLVLILSFLFSMLELARVRGLAAQTEMNASLSMMSMFGNYNVPLWKDYGLLFLDGNWGKAQGDGFSVEEWEARSFETVFENTREIHSLFAFVPENVEIRSYELATDGGGSAFARQVAERAKKDMPESVLETLLHGKEKSEELEFEKEEMERNWEAALDAASQAEEEKSRQRQVREEERKKMESAGKKESLPSLQEEDFGVSEVENPMEYVKGLKSSPILSLVLQDPSKLSTRGINLENALEPLAKRQKSQGNWEETRSNEGIDRLWIQYYIHSYFSHGAAPSEKGSEHRALSYEMEYLLQGENSDRENLEGVVKELLLIREGANFLYLMGDTEKSSLAMGIATATVGFTGLPPLVKAVQMGILLSWAYMESILEVRALLEGKKIPLVKTAADWSSDLVNFRGSMEGSGPGKDDEKGLDYESYLQMLLLLQPSERLHYRMMDIMEQNIRLTWGNESVRMDAMVQSAEADFRYRAKPLFWNLIFLKHSGWNHFSFGSSQRFSYME